MLSHMEDQIESDVILIICGHLNTYHELIKGYRLPFQNKSSEREKSVFKDIN